MKVKAKKKMKTIGVVIVIITMLGFTQADHYNPSYVQVEPNSESNGSSCKTICKLECAPLVRIAQLSLICVNDCSEICLTKSIVAANDCMTSCGLVKSINVNNGIYSLITLATF